MTKLETVVGDINEKIATSSAEKEKVEKENAV